MKDLIQEFKDFINKGNVIVLAVGLVMGLYFQSIVQAILDGVINPLIAAIFGKDDFVDIGFTVNGSLISIGQVINAAIMFILVAFLLFLVVKAYNKYLVKPAAEEAPALSELQVLEEIRDLLANR